MKKLLTLFLAAFLLSGALGVGKAQASAIFDMDLTNVGGNDYGYYDDVASITTSGFGFINQSFGNNNPYAFDEGDTFSEYSVFQQIGYKQGLYDNLQFSGLPANLMMFAWAESLSGYATNFEDGKFDYIFNPGSALNIYIGEYVTLDQVNAAYVATATPIASLLLLAGEGAGSDGYLDGEDTGTTRLLTTLDYTNTPSGIWSTDILGDLTDLSYPTYFTLFTTNTIKQYELYQTPNGAGFNAIAQSTGDIFVHPTPEPSTMLLLGAGLLGLAAAGRKMRKN